MDFEDRLTRLALSISWVAEDRRRLSKLKELLRESFEWAGPSGVELVENLISRFKFLNATCYDEAIYTLAEYIASEFDIASIKISAATADGNKDSGQKILYDLISALADIGHYQIKNSNRFDQLIRDKADYSDIILVDEFIGTGATMNGRAKRIKTQFRDAKRNIPRIHGLALAGMKNAMQWIEKSEFFDSVGVVFSLLKGIGQMADLKSRQLEYKTMEKLESFLASDFGGETLHRFGYGAAEALYARKAGSCPNNVFPIFWWPLKSDKMERQPVFPRAL